MPAYNSKLVEAEPATRRAVYTNLRSVKPGLRQVCVANVKSAAVANRTPRPSTDLSAGERPRGKLGGSITNHRQTSEDAPCIEEHEGTVGHHHRVPGAVRLMGFTLVKAGGVVVCALLVVACGPQAPAAATPYPP